VRLFAGLVVFTLALVSDLCWAAEPLGSPPTPAASAAGHGRALALLIAIQGYSRFGKGWDNLDGTINDIVLMQDVLMKRFGFSPKNITMICDNARVCSGQPTRKGIAAAFQSLIGRARHGDLVYIQYSGHGDTVPDANGDEPGPNGRDSTWVPIDARDNESWEILDDEIHLWLARLGQHTDDVVLVSDSCHSGTITRGRRSSKVRGVPVTDYRDYSWSRKSLGGKPCSAAGCLADLTSVKPPAHLVRISSARDTQQAYEYEALNKKNYGRFTWFWAKALQAAAPGQSYDAVYRSVSAMMPPREQQPVIEGAVNLALFQARFSEQPRQIAAVRVDGKQVDFDDGLLSGITVGSLFEHAAGGARGKPVKVRIDTVDAYKSHGSIQGAGKVKPGDRFEETEHVYQMPRLRISVRADAAKDHAIKKKLHDAVRALGNAVEMVPQDQHADVILHLARVTSGSDGAPQLDPDGLPARGSNDAPLECWILDDAEKLYAPDLRVPIGTGAGIQADDGVKRVKLDVERIVRNRGILEVAAQGRQALGETLGVEPLRLTDAREDETGPDVVEIPFGEGFKNKPVKQHVEPIEERGGEVQLKRGDFITFGITNHTSREHYFYLVNITPDGTSQVVFPDEGFDDNAKVPPQPAPYVIRESAVQVDGPRDIYLWFVTDVPTNVWALQGKGFEKGAARRGANTALARLLQQAGGLTRGRPAAGKGPSDFAARKIVVHTP
jgi:hypothetical protein